MSGGDSPRYTVHLAVAGRPCVVIGPGFQLQGEARALSRCGADVTVIAPAVGETLAELEAAGAIRVERRGYVRGDLDGAFLAVVATGSEEIDSAVASEARERGCLIRLVDSPDDGDFGPG